MRTPAGEQSGQRRNTTASPPLNAPGGRCCDRIRHTGAISAFKPRGSRGQPHLHKSKPKAHQIDERLYKHLRHRIGHKPIDVGLNASESDSSCELTTWLSCNSVWAPHVANGVPAITKTGTEMSAAYSVSIDICVGRAQRSAGGQGSKATLHACISNTSRSLCLRVLITASAGREPYRTFTKLRRRAARQLTARWACALHGAHIESLSFADMRVMHPMNEMQACNRTTLPMSCTCICMARVSSRAARAQLYAQTRHQEAAEHGANHKQYNKQHGRHARSRAVELRKVRLSSAPLSLGGQKTLHLAPGAQSCGGCTMPFRILQDAQRGCASSLA